MIEVTKKLSLRFPLKSNTLSLLHRFSFSIQNKLLMIKYYLFIPFINHCIAIYVWFTPKRILLKRIQENSKMIPTTQRAGHVMSLDIYIHMWPSYKKRKYKQSKTNNKLASSFSAKGKAENKKKQRFLLKMLQSVVDIYHCLLLRRTWGCSCFLFLYLDEVFNDPWSFS